MVINGFSLLKAAPIKDMESTKVARHGVSFGLGEAGYDIRIKQAVTFKPNGYFTIVMNCCVDGEVHVNTRFALASSKEEFQMPEHLMGIVHDKSTWARKGLSVFNTVIEPGWKGFLTLELVYHGNEELVIPADAGIAQVVFHSLSDHAAYVGKYQNQEDMPVAPRNSV